MQGLVVVTGPMATSATICAGNCLRRVTLYVAQSAQWIKPLTRNGIRGSRRPRGRRLGQGSGRCIWVVSPCTIYATSGDGQLILDTANKGTEIVFKPPPKQIMHQVYTPHL